jgi:hypothetical protein
MRLKKHFSISALLRKSEDMPIKKGPLEKIIQPRKEEKRGRRQEIVVYSKHPTK